MKKKKTFWSNFWIIIIFGVMVIFGPIILSRVLNITTTINGESNQFIILTESGVNVNSLIAYYVAAIGVISTFFLGLMSYRINKHQYNLINKDRDKKPDLYVYCNKIEVHYPFENIHFLKEGVGKRELEKYLNGNLDIEEIFNLNNVTTVHFHLPMILYNDSPNSIGIPIHEVEMTIKVNQELTATETSNSIIVREIKGYRERNMRSEWFNYQFVKGNNAIDREFEFVLPNKFSNDCMYEYEIRFGSREKDFIYGGKFKYLDFRKVVQLSKDKIEELVNSRGISSREYIVNALAGKDTSENDSRRFKLSNSYYIEMYEFEKIE